MTAADEYQRVIAADLWCGHLCPALTRRNALKEAQRDLVALGADWAEAGRILSRVHASYVDAAHQAAQRYVAQALAADPGVRAAVEQEALERVRVARREIEALADSIHGDTGWAHNSGCEGEPDCFACIEADLRRIVRALMPRKDGEHEGCLRLPNKGDETCLTLGEGRDHACDHCRAVGWPRKDGE